MVISLRNRLILASLVVTLPILVAVVYFFASSAAQSKRNMIDDSMVDMATTMADSASRWDQYVQSVLENISSQPDIISMSPEKSHEALRRMNHAFDRLDFIQITAMNGQAVARSDQFPLLSYSDRHWFRQIQKTRESTYDVVVSRTNGRTIVLLATPIFDGDKLKGAVVAGIDLAKLNAEINLQAYRYPNNTFLVDQNGVILCHQNADFINKITSMAEMEPVRSVLSGKAGPFAYNDIQGSRLKVYAVHLSNGWTVITERAQSNINAEINKIWKMAALIATIAAVMIIGLQWYMASRIARPIHQITLAANDLANGKWDTRVTPMHHDEVGQLSESFNRMADELKKSYQDVEEKIKQRTTELANSNKALQNARAIAEHASQAKDDFLTNVSHELRTPLTAVLGYTELMMDPTTAPEMPQDTLRAIRSNAMHLLQIVNDILDHSKIVAGGLTVDLQPCSLLNIIREVTDCIMPRAKAKSLKFDLQVDPTLPPNITTDSLRLKQAVINLLSNAVKFTNQGTVELHVYGEGENDHRTLHFLVRDTGVGIPPEHIPNLFKGFSQADTSRTRRYGGTGLGLSIAHGLAALLGGNITAESKLGMGSTFIFSMPLRVPQSAQSKSSLTVPPGSSAKVMGGTLDGMKILLVEDGVDNQRLISMVLKKAGASVELAENGSVALEILAKKEFDAVLMDMQMPVMDGYTATRTLRTRGYTTPVIAVTAHAMAEDRAKCLASGCDDYMVKPIDRVKLINCIREHLDQHKGN